MLAESIYNLYNKDKNKNFKYIRYVALIYKEMIPRTKTWDIELKKMLCSLDHHALKTSIQFSVIVVHAISE